MSSFWKKYNYIIRYHQYKVFCKAFLLKNKQTGRHFKISYRRTIISDCWLLRIQTAQAVVLKKYFGNWRIYLLTLATSSFQVFRLELSLVPAEDASQNSHGIHPNLLSITIKDKNKRIKYRGNLTNPKAWKLVLLITNGQVYYQDHEGNLLKADDLVNGNKLLLGKSY